MHGVTTRAHRLLSVYVDFKRLLLQGFQSDLHFGDVRVLCLTSLWTPWILLKCTRIFPDSFLLAHYSLSAAIFSVIFFGHKQTWPSKGIHMRIVLYACATAQTTERASGVKLPGEKWLPKQNSQASGRPIIAVQWVTYKIHCCTDGQMNRPRCHRREKLKKKLAIW